MQVKLHYDAIACYQKALTIAEKILQEATSHLNNSEAIHNWRSSVEIFSAISKK